MLLIYDETTASERFLSWPNWVCDAILKAIFALERFFHIATETAIAIATAIAFLILDAIETVIKAEVLVIFFGWGFFSLMCHNIWLCEGVPGINMGRRC